MSASMNPFGQKKPTVGGFPDQGSSGSGQKPAFGGFGSTPTQLGDEAPPTFYWQKTDTEKPVRSCIQNDYEPPKGSSGSGQKPAFGGFGSTPTQLGDEAPPTFYWKKTDTEKPVRSCIQNDYEPPKGKGSSGSGQKKPAFGGFGSTPTQLGDEGAPTIVQFFAEKPSPTYPFKPSGTYIPDLVIFAEKPSPTNPFKSLPDKAFRLF